MCVKLWPSQEGYQIWSKNEKYRKHSYLTPLACLMSQALMVCCRANKNHPNKVHINQYNFAWINSLAKQDRKRYVIWTHVFLPCWTFPNSHHAHWQYLAIYQHKIKVVINNCNKIFIHTQPYNDYLEWYNMIYWAIKMSFHYWKEVHLRYLK